MKKPSLKSLKKKTWAKCSEYIRRKYAAYNGMVRCVTCGTVKHWKEMQAGHFIDGRNNAILFDERGIHPQCYSCNIMKHGNKIEYFKFMELNYGRALIDELCIQSKKTVKFTTWELEDIIKKYDEKIKLLTPQVSE